MPPLSELCTVNRGGSLKGSMNIKVDNASWYTLGELFGGCSRRHVVKNFPRMSFPAREKRKITKTHTPSIGLSAFQYNENSKLDIFNSTPKNNGCCFFSQPICQYFSRNEFLSDTEIPCSENNHFTMTRHIYQNKQKTTEVEQQQQLPKLLNCWCPFSVMKQGFWKIICVIFFAFHEQPNIIKHKSCEIQLKKCSEWRFITLGPHICDTWITLSQWKSLCIASPSWRIRIIH